MLYSTILGVIQGLTELWPISSSAHLYLVPFLSGFRDLGLTMTVFLHFGTFLAVVIYFYQDWLEIISQKRKVFFLIILATIPAALAGLLLERQAETLFRSPLIISFSLIVFALLLGWSDWSGKRKEELKNLSWAKALLIGLGQALALVPGVSRSGITITAALFLGLKRSQAARFSFLLLAPILFGATFLRLIDILQNGVSVIGGSWSAALTGFLASFIASYFALTFLFKWLKKGSFWPFVFYRIGLALVVLSIYLY